MLIDILSNARKEIDAIEDVFVRAELGKFMLKLTQIVSGLK